MKRLTRAPGMAIALAIAVLGLQALPAAAQWLGPHLDAQRYDNLRRHQQRMQQQRQQQHTSADRALTPHQRACAQRHRSYDPATDTYLTRAGGRARCRL